VNERMAGLMLAAIVGVLLTVAVYVSLPEFGSFPLRNIGGNRENAIGQRILENAPRETGSGNVVTGVVWGYRGYDTLGEATILFTAVVGVVALFRAFGRRRA